MKHRKLFCEISPLCYEISVFKCCMLRRLRDLFSKERFCRKHSAELLTVKYHIESRNEHFTQADGVWYRNGEVWRQCVDKDSGKVIKEKLIKTNHAHVMYDEKYITSNRGNYE